MSEAIHLLPVGYEDSNPWRSPGGRVRSWWIGKPWRRVEVNVYGDGEFREWDVSVAVGLVRFGWHAHFTLARSWNDYSDEAHQ